MDTRVSPSEALNGLRLSLKNADALIEEAKILLGAGHTARALALAILATEELAKLPRYAAVSIYAAEGRWKQWWKYYRSHREKLEMHHLHTVLSIPEDLEGGKLLALIGDSMGKTLDRLKQAALYTDFQDGKFVSPLDLPKAQELAEAAITYAESTLPIHRFVAERTTPEILDRVGRKTAALKREARRQGKPVMSVLAEAMAHLVEQPSKD